MDKLNKPLPVAALAGLCALIFFLRLHTYDEPLERDITIYAVIAHEMLDGKALYSDLWDHKPPAIYVTYAAAELIAGYGRDSIFLMNVAAALATLFACYFAGSAAGFAASGFCGFFICLSTSTFRTCIIAACRTSEISWIGAVALMWNDE